MSKNDIAVPVYNKDGTILLWDMYINGVWHGSRRTLAQVNEYYEGRKT